MALLILIFSVVLLLVLIVLFKINALFSLLIAAIAVGFLQGMPGEAILKSVENGLGSTLGQLALILAFGAILGKLIADGGGAQRITTGLIKIFGEKNLQWAMALTGFLVGIPLFYNVGFVVLVPLIFMVCATTRLPLLFVALPLLASLSVTHGYLPPHPGATAIAILYQADIGLTMIYGIIIAIPAIIIGGPVFSKTLTKIKPDPPKGLFEVDIRTEEELPGLGISLLTGLFPVFLIAVASIIESIFHTESIWMSALAFIGNPVVALLLAIMLALYTMGIQQQKSMKALMESIEDSVKSIAMILFIIGAAGAFKEVLVDSGIGEYVSDLAQGLSFSPLLLVWIIAAVIRVSLGSATVAGLTAAGIALPIMEATNTSPELMVLATGAGSLMFSHVNDPGFWMFKEYFGLTIKDTIRSWSLMETIISVVGLIGVLIMDRLI